MHAPRLYRPGGLDVAVADGGTGASTAVQARLNLGIDPSIALQSNLSAVVDPVVTDDDAAGYSVGSLWVNNATDDAFICVDNTNGAAVWDEINALASAAPVGASYVTLGNDATLTDERVLTGTVNQITVTDGGAGTTVTLSLPQDIHAGASPDFTGLTVGGSSVYYVGGGDVSVADGGTGASDAGTARGNLGLAIGSDVQAWDADLDALAALGATGIVARTGAATYSPRTITGTANQVSVADGDGVAGNPTLSLPQDIHSGASPDFTGLTVGGNSVYYATGTDVPVTDGGTGASDAATARTNLGVAIGSDAQAWDADLDAIAALSSADSNFIVGSAGGWVAESGSTVRASAGAAPNDAAYIVQTAHAELSGEQALDALADGIVYNISASGTLAIATISTGLSLIGSTLRTSDGQIVHDNLSGYVADEHVAHGGVTLTAGTGLSGGGTIAANRTFNVDGVLADLVTLGANAADSEFLVGTGAGALAWETGATARTSLGVAIGTNVQAQDAFLQDIADLSDPGADRLLGWDDVGAAGVTWFTLSTGLTITGTTVTVDTGALDHGALTGKGDDDHTQYLLADGTRTLAGAWDMGSQNLTNVNIDSGVITGITDLAVADGGTGASSAGDARTNLGLVIGTNVQAFGAVLDDLNTLGANSGDSEFLVGTGAGALAWENAATAATSMGLGTGDAAQFTTLGVGITRTEGTVHVHTASAGSVTASTAANDLVIENNADCGISILAPDADIAIIYMGGPTDPTSAGILMDLNTSVMTVGTKLVGGETQIHSGNSATALTLDSSQNADFAGNITVTGTSDLEGTASIGNALAVTTYATLYVARNYSYSGNTQQQRIYGTVTQTGASGTSVGLYVDAAHTINNAAFEGKVYQCYFQEPQVTDTDSTDIQEATTVYISGAPTEGTLNYAVHVNAGATQLDGTLGVGLALTEGTAHIHTASAGSVTANTGGNDLVVENSTDCGISILAPDASSSLLYFGSPADSVGAQVAWKQSTATMNIGTHMAGGTMVLRTAANTTAVTIDANQDVFIEKQVAIGGSGFWVSDWLSILATSGADMSLENSGDSPVVIRVDADRSSANSLLGGLLGYWNNANVGAFKIASGSDTGNKDDGELWLQTSDGGGVVTHCILDNSGGFHFLRDASTADPTVRANYAAIYSKDVAASAEIFVQDEASNVTQISPHDVNGWWYFNSYSAQRDLTIRAHIEQAFRWLIAEKGMPAEYLEEYPGNHTAA